MQCLVAGTIKTQLAEVDMQNKKKREYLEHRIPMSWVVTPEDLAGSAVFLASEELSGFMTSLQALVDGGIFNDAYTDNLVALYRDLRID